MADQLPNPYEKFGAHHSEVQVGHGWAWGLTVVFLLLCTLPPFWRNVKELTLGDHGWTPVVELFQYSPKEGTLREHLRDAEGKIEDAGFTRPVRRGFQALLTTVLREGNRKTTIGSDDWLYFGPAISALTGYGPLKSEPDTVARDPNREPWRGPLPAITRFNEQLEELDVELILMPIPVKPMIHPEPLTGRSAEGPITHPDADAFFAQLRESGVEVLDLSKEWFAGKEQAFLKQDTHWTPEQMQASARLVVEHLRSRPWFGELASNSGQFSAGETRQVEAPGDLLDNLDLPDSMTRSRGESAEIAPVRNADGSELSIYDPESPLVLLGDSFTNIFHQEDMKWGTESGFAQHLSRELRFPLDTIAQNGQASTGVRKTLATRQGAVHFLRKKKAVLWAIAARDLFLSETVARENQVEWKDVTFQDTPPPATDLPDPIRIRGKMTMKSNFPNPNDVNYPTGVYAAEYQVEEVLEGEYEEDAVIAFHWAFRDKVLEEAAAFEEGSVRVLELIPLEATTAPKSATQLNDSDRFDLLSFWDLASDPTTATGQAGEGQAEKKSTAPEAAVDRASRIASIATLGFSVVLCLAMMVIYRRMKALRETSSVSPAAP